LFIDGDSTYEIIRKLGEGKTSRVYLCRSIYDHQDKVAVKIFKEEFFARDKNAIRHVESEIQIL